MSGCWRERLSRLGFGVSGAHGTALVRRSETVDLIALAAELGVTAFDTAPAYGDGEAERRLGTAIRRIGRDRLVLSTKAGLRSRGLAGKRRDFSPRAIEASVRASLARLGVAGVDVLFLHGPDPAELTADLFATLAGLRNAGAFAALGVAGRGGELDAALGTGRFDAMMAPVHPFLCSEEESRLEGAARAGLAVFAIETAGDAPAPGPLPRRASDLYSLFRSLRPSGAGRGRVAPGSGLTAALSRETVSCALTTTTRRDHLQANIAAAVEAPRG